MLKSSTSGFDKPLFPELIASIEALPQTLEDEALEKAVMLEARLVVIYATPPPRDNSKFVWSLDPVKNRRGQRGFFARVRSGEIQTDGKHSIRQGKPPYGAKVDVIRQGNTITMIITQTDPNMKWPFGTQQADTRNPGHKRTGWPYAAPLVAEASNQILVMLIDDVVSRIGRI
jgi:hypothetical protein